MVNISMLKEQIIDNFAQVRDLISNGQYKEAIKIAGALFFGLDAGISNNTYPVVINRDFTSVLVTRAREPRIQKILSRMHEVDFDSSRLIEFMVPILVANPTYSILKFPYQCKLSDIYGFRIEEDSWRSFQRAFLDIEGIDISGITRHYEVRDLEIELLGFHVTLDRLILELFKNAVVYAYSENGRLTGNIHEEIRQDSV